MLATIPIAVTICGNGNAFNVLRAWGAGIESAAGIGNAKNQTKSDSPILLGIFLIRIITPTIRNGKSHKYSTPIPFTLCLPFESPLKKRKSGDISETYPCTIPTISFIVNNCKSL